MCAERASVEVVSKRPGEHVTVIGELSGQFVVRQRNADGTILLAPETREERYARLGVQPATKEDFDAFVAEHGPLLPPDGEG
jgi:hypothetical protein